MNRTAIHEEIHRMLSAYFDEELTQADSQRVQVHLEECEHCRTALREMFEIQQIASQMKFRQPPEAMMDALETTMSVRTPRALGWTILLLCLAGWGVYAVIYSIKHVRWPDVVELTIGGTLTGVVLLFVSVVRQRLLERPHDRYRKVKR